ncbi:MAG TPA: MarR family transcriptional regulator [Vicinamibacterales bacterium]|jgi:DNA-binding MarR family transcriptional regulator
MKKGRKESSEIRSLEPALEFMRLLWNIEHALQSASKHMETALGITGPQRLVLKIVTAFPGISAQEVARIIHLHPSTITGILQRLVRKGLLVRARDRRDGRRVRLHARPQAKAFTRLSTGTIEAAVRRALARVPPRKIRETREMLAAIVTALETGRE